MTAGLTELPPHQDLTPGRRWWRRLRFLPLMALGVASVLALGVGVIVTQSERDASAPVLPTVSPLSEDPASAVCRPPVSSPATEPWFENRDASERAWADRAADTSEPYLIGPNGWIFWSDDVDQYASQAVGRALLAAKQVSAWVDHLAAIRDSLAARGVEFYVIVTPSTSSVYTEELPVWMQTLRGSTIMDQFIGATGDLPVMDLRADLQAAKGGPEHLFSWSNSHWTDFGAYTAWQQIAGCVNTLYPDSPPLRVPQITGATVVGDFNEWAGYDVPSPGADWSVPDYAEPMQEVTRIDASGATEIVSGEMPTDLSILPAETSVADSWTGKSALIFRDSMGGGLSPLWQQAYSPTWQVRQPYASGYSGAGTYEKAVEEYAPDVVILQLAERYLLNAPPAGSGY